MFYIRVVVLKTELLGGRTNITDDVLCGIDVGVIIECIHLARWVEYIITAVGGIAQTQLLVISDIYKDLTHQCLFGVGIHVSVFVLIGSAGCSRIGLDIVVDLLGKVIAITIEVLPALFARHAQKEPETIRTTTDVGCRFLVPETSCTEIDTPMEIFGRLLGVDLDHCAE